MTRWEGTVTILDCVYRKNGAQLFARYECKGVRPVRVSLIRTVLKRRVKRSQLVVAMLIHCYPSIGLVDGARTNLIMLIAGHMIQPLAMFLAL